MAGKEWILGSQAQHLVGANIKFVVRGGDRYTPVNEKASLEKGSLVTYENQMYKSRFNPKLRMDFTLNYSFNRKFISHNLSFKVLNLTGTSEYYRHRFDPETWSILKDEVKIILPNFSYKISF